MKSSGGEGKRRTPVQPLSLPPSAEDRNGLSSVPVRTRDKVPAKPVELGSGPKPKPRPHKGSSQSQKGSKSTPPGRKGVEEEVKREKKKRKKFSSPLKRLYEGDYLRQRLAKGTFETQYQAHYKDWVAGQRREAGKENSKSLVVTCIQPHCSSNVTFIGGYLF